MKFVPTRNNFLSRLSSIILMILTASASFIVRAENKTYAEVEPGLYYRALNLNPGLKLHVFKADLHKVKLKTVSQAGWKPAFAIDMVKQTGALVAANSSFFDTHGAPLGLVLENGKILHPAKDISWWGAFLLDKQGRPHLEKISANQDLSAYTFGVQAGPRLVVNSQTPKLKSETSPKTAVGMDAKGYVYLIASEGSIEINALAKKLSEPESKGGVGLTQALNLDGGSSTQLYHRSKNLTVSIPAFSRVPVGIAFFK